MKLLLGFQYSSYDVCQKFPIYLAAVFCLRFIFNKFPIRYIHQKFSIYFAADFIDRLMINTQKTLAQNKDHIFWTIRCA